MKANAYRVILEDQLDGVWTAEIPAFGICTEGNGERDALRMARKAIDGYLWGTLHRGFPIPPFDAIAIAPSTRKPNGRLRGPARRARHSKASVGQRA
jgi:predicted RNase H-like HicB family nuclease